MKTFVTSVLLSLVCMLSLTGTLQANAVLNFTRGWDRFLRQYVVVGKTGDPFLGTAVPYSALAKDPEAPGALASLSKTLETASAPTQPVAAKAFWINVYNFGALRAVVTGWPLSSIRDLNWLPFRVWKKITVDVGGTSFSLDRIENGIVRPMGDPRIHFALNCASRSCPDLRPEAYRADRLDRQLAEQIKAFLGNDNKGLVVANGHCSMSRIFDWFADDFGTPDQWLRTVGGSMGKKCAVSREKEFLSYNWAVNQTHPVATQTGHESKPKYKDVKGGGR